MIASYRHGFVFIKTRKTAGTSVEIAISPWCGPEDILSPISAYHDRERYDAGGGLPRHWSRDPELERRYGECIVPKVLAKRSRTLKLEMRTAWQRDIAEGRPSPFLSSHANALEAKDWDPELWDRALKVTVERHPYEKAVSLAYFRTRRGVSAIDPSLTWAEHLDRIVREDGKYSSGDAYRIGGESVVDVFLRQESLEADLHDLARRLGVPPPAALPRARSDTRTDRTPAREVLTDDQKAVIYERCRAEFELLGWER